MRGRFIRTTLKEARRELSVAEEIFELFENRGDEAYFGESVSQKEHALQAAYLAETSGAEPALVVAALLHDIGHLTHGLDEDVADQGIDARHEAVGEAWLSRHFGPEIVEPVSLHVAAKRYLCATDSEYLSLLSPASLQSLELQGGPFSEEERLDFERNPHYKEALSLRSWDDRAKIPGLAVPDLEYYRAYIEGAAKE